MQPIRFSCSKSSREFLGPFLRKEEPSIFGKSSDSCFRSDIASGCGFATLFYGAVAVSLFFLLVLGCAKEGTLIKDQPSQKGYPIAVLPFENMTATLAPVKEIRTAFITHLKSQGFNVLDEETLEKIMERHRIRYVGGIDQGIAQAFKTDAGVKGVLVTSLEMYIESFPPKIAIISRLVSTGDKPTILWMDGVGMAGDDSPGILGIGLIGDPKTLLTRALQSLSDSLANFVWNDKRPVPRTRRERRFEPQIAFRSPEINPGEKYTVAVVPFLNTATRRYAGEIVVLHFVQELTKLGRFNVLELGAVRQRLLNARVILEGGIALEDVSLVANSLDADFVMAGKVTDYQDYEGSGGKPKIDFTIQILERRSRKIVWSSESHSEGDDGVFFFDRGKINTAHVMMNRMVQMIGRKISEEK